MDNLTQLESCSHELATAVKILASYSRSVDAQQNSTHPPLVDPEAPEDVHRARANILSSIAKARALVCGPTDFLQHLAIQVGSFASIHFHLGADHLRVKYSRACDG
jgi:hypothetical protein